MSDDLIPVPYDQLSVEALNGLIQEYVSRDGTNLADLESKVKHVRRQLDQGDVIIVFDPEAETTNIVRVDSRR